MNSGSKTNGIEGKLPVKLNLLEREILNRDKSEYKTSKVIHFKPLQHSQI